MTIHKEAPTWFKCEHCLWWATRFEVNMKGQKPCSSNKVELTSPDWRCPNWTCRRCLGNWQLGINHNFCKSKGRANPESKWG